MSWTHEHAVEVDRRLLEVLIERNKEGRNVTFAVDEVMHTAGFERQYRSRNVRVWMRRGQRQDADGKPYGTLEPATLEDAIEIVTGRVQTAPTEWDRSKASSVLAKLAGSRTRYSVSCERVRLIDEEWAKCGRWPRFYLVANAGGHIHKSMSCSTCRPSTQYVFLPELSGLSEEQAVKAQGPVLCSICFPSAPIDWTEGSLSPEQRKALKAHPTITAS